MPTNKRARRTVLLFGVACVATLALWPRDLPASIEDQRARLPPPPDPNACADEVSGIWRAHVYYARLRDWYRYELRIARTGDALTGTILLRGWTGTPSENEPPACRPGLRDAEWSEPATGVVTRDARGTTVRFDATSWRLERTHCGRPSDEYALDHFTGLLDGARQEFTSINSYTFPNGDHFEDPTLFRRVQCTPRDGAGPRVTTVVVPTGTNVPPPMPEGRRRRLFSCAR
ncbi:MAG: hypothetical protein JNK05_24715 [Myxococcales bacterium]|nr:hypothetical protein [Myxococcales bacterium]